MRSGHRCQRRGDPPLAQSVRPPRVRQDPAHGLRLPRRTGVAPNQYKRHRKGGSAAKNGNRRGWRIPPNFSWHGPTPDQPVTQGTNRSYSRIATKKLRELPVALETMSRNRTPSAAGPSPRWTWAGKHRGLVSGAATACAAPGDVTLPHRHIDRLPASRRAPAG